MFDHLKEPAEGGFFFSKNLAQISAKISPPKPKILATSLIPWLRI